MTTAPAYVVLGGTGRLGRCLLARLRAQGCRTIGVSRRADATGGAGAEWVQVDLTDATRWAQAQQCLCQLLAGEKEIVLADLVLDRTDVASMRRSIRAATAFTLQLQNVLVTGGFRVRVLAASTTAVLAPRALQTPYGKAKRAQAFRYAQLSRVDLVLLPQLLDAAESRVGAVGHSCTYAAAAAALLALSQSPADRALWCVRGSDPPPYVQRGLAGMSAYLGALLRAHTVGRNSPAAHRWASRAGLAVLPPRIRMRVDHHTVPDQRIRDLARRLGFTGVRTVTAESPSAASKEDHEEHP